MQRVTTLPPIGIGTYDVEPAACTAAVATALDYGYRHIDTAEMYGTESAVASGLSRSSVDRDAVVIATKLHSANLAYDDAIEHAKACRDRLEVDVIDLLYVHWPIRTYDPTETLSAFDALYDEGIIGAVGLSNFTPRLLEEAIDRLDAPLCAHQVECHPLLPQPELRQLAIEDDHTLVAYSPLAKGAVLDDPTMTDIATTHGVSPAQVTLAWLHAKDNVVPIPCSTTPAHIRENFDALDLKLDQHDLDRIDAIDRTERVVDFEGAPWRQA